MEEAPTIERGERRSKEQDGMGTMVFAWNEVEARYALGRLRGARCYEDVSSWEGEGQKKNKAEGIT